MTCENCVAHEKEALEGLGESSVDFSQYGGYAVFNTDKSDAELKSAIEDEGYDVTGIQ